MPLLVRDMCEHSYHIDFRAAAGQYADAFFNNINWEQVLARMEALRLSACARGRASSTRYRDPRNYYIVRANALENNVVLYKVEDGRRIPLPPIARGNDYGVAHRVPAQSWSTLAVTFSGARFVVTFDGAPLFKVKDSTFTSAGQVGLWTKADSVTYFDGFEVTAR